MGQNIIFINVSSDLLAEFPVIVGNPNRLTPISPGMSPQRCPRAILLFVSRFIYIYNDLVEHQPTAVN